MPAPGSGISPYEFRTLFRETRAFMEAATRAEPIDLTSPDDDVPQFCDQSSSHAVSEQFESLQVGLRVSLNQRRTSGTPSNSDSSNSQRRSLPARNFPEDTSPSWSRKKKESPAGNGGIEHWLSTKRRLRPSTQVVYAEDAALSDAMELDEPEPETDLLESVEMDDDDESDESDNSETEEWEVKRVVAEKRGPRVHEFLLDWVDSDEQNWIPAKRCRCRDLISDFRAIPRVPADAHYLATLERNKLRRADNARRTGAARPQNVRPRGQGSFQNSETGRFEKRRVAQSPIRLDLEIPDSDADDDELGFDVGSPRPSVWRNQEARTPSKTPSLDHFSASVTRSPASTIADSQQSDLSPEYHQNLQETVVWVRKTPMDDDDHPSGSPRERSKSVQRPMQTAKITWIRDTPGFQDEQFSFLRSDGTVIFTSTKTKRLPSPTNPPPKVAESMVDNSMVPRPDARPLGSTSINSRSSPSISQQISRWTAIRSNAVPASPESHVPPFSVITTQLKPTRHTLSHSSASVPANPNQLLNLPHSKPFLVTETFLSHSRCSPGAFKPVNSSLRSSPASHSPVPSRATSISKSMPPPPPRLSSQAGPGLARHHFSTAAPSTKPTSFTSPPPVAAASQGGQTGSSSSPTTALRWKRLKPKAKKPLTSPSRRSIETTPSGSMPRQPAGFSWSPPGSPVRSPDKTGSKRLSEPGIAHLPRAAPNPPKNYSSPSVPMPDVAAPSSQPEPFIDISDLLDMAASITLAPQSTHCIPFPRPIRETSTPAEAMPRIPPSTTFPTPGMAGHDAERRITTGGTQEAGTLGQRRTGNGQQPPLGAQKNPLNGYHGFMVKVTKNLDGRHRSSPTAATPGTMRQSRSPIRREKGHKQKKLTRDNFTRAIEVEVASDASLHVASKKATGAVLLNASANAFRGPTTTQKQPENNKRSPSVATEWFIAARKKEKEDALARAPKGVRPALNRDLGL